MPLSSPANEATLALDQLRLESDRRLAGMGQLLMLVPAVWFIYIDFELYGGDWVRLRQRLALRAILIVLPAAGFLTMRAVHTREAYSRAVLWMAILFAAVTLGFNVIRPAGSGLPLRSPLLVMAVLYFAMPNRPMLQCLPPFALGAGTVALRLTWLSDGPVDVGGDVIAIAALNALGILAVARRVRLEEATSEVARELKTLRGIIPICSHCRKLRTEVGDWQQLEQYFKDRSEALFSHGICPDCLATLYTDEMLR